MTKIYFTLFASLFFIHSSKAQNNGKELQLGVKITNDLTLYNGYAPGFGGQVVYKMGKHGGLESGLYYESRYQAFITQVQTGPMASYYITKITESWLQLPLLYRFDSKFINFVIGPALDYFIGWKVKHADPGVTVNDYDRNAVRLVTSIGISKSFDLSPTIILEPEAKFNYFPSEDDGGLLLNISLRKRLH